MEKKYDEVGDTSQIHVITRTRSPFYTFAKLLLETEIGLTLQPSESEQASNTFGAFGVLKAYLLLKLSQNPRSQPSVQESEMASWITIEDDSDFSLQNLPYGIFSTTLDPQPRIGTAVGQYVLDLKALAQDGAFSPISFDSLTLESQTLNEYAALDKRVHREVRVFLQDLLSAGSTNGPSLRDNKARQERALIPISDVEMHLPMAIGNYTDFFVGLHHIENVSHLCFLVIPGCTSRS